jgi:hypothetical protein
MRMGSDRTDLGLCLKIAFCVTVAELEKYSCGRV